MAAFEPLEFSHADRRRIYEHVERTGSVSADDLPRNLGIDPSGFRHHVAILKRDGLVAEGEGKLRVDFEEGEVETFETGDWAVTIRQARQDDLEGLTSVIREVADERTDIVAESVAGVLDHEEVLLRHNDVASRMFFVATIGEAVVGWVHLEAPELEKLAHTAKLTVGVLGDHQGYGIGSTLLERGLSWAGANGYEKLYNSIPATNEDAISFLESKGFETEAVRKNHYKIGEEYTDEVMMAIVV
ncbi:GNAT family N-acetyltransferase [Halobacteriales archaeon QH_6_64_20]|nr:MAG: GNAT family N-acetyltransferase [Halobacteriales archaeon QH_6_64_20]